MATLFDPIRIGDLELKNRIVMSPLTRCRVGLHLAPKGDTHSMGDSNSRETFSHVARAMSKRQLAFICTRDYVGDGFLGEEIRREFNGAYIANEKFTKGSAEEFVAAGKADAVAFGKLFIANPDLVRRFRENLPLNAPNPTTFYASGAKGCTDYPFYSGNT